MAKKNVKKDKTDSVLVISDLHAPYCHKDAVEFLSALNEKYEFDQVVCIGDELDYHAMSFHDSHPGLLSPSFELAAGRKVLRAIESLFPEVNLVSSNHGDMKYRKAKAGSIPMELLVSYQEACGVQEGWQWHVGGYAPNICGKKISFVHQFEKRTRGLPSHNSISTVQGHYHSIMSIEHVQVPGGDVRFGMTVGCLIDDESLAFAYNKRDKDRPITGCGIILDGQPYLKRMVLDEDNRWIGRIV